MVRSDIVFAPRAARQTPGFTAAAVISIALGIAANTTVFSRVNATLLSALPVRDPGGLYSFGGGKTFPLPDYRDFRDQCAGVFDGLAGEFPLAPASLATGGEAAGDRTAPGDRLGQPGARTGRRLGSAGSPLLCSTASAPPTRSRSP